MGQSILDIVVQLLNEKGVQAAPAQPSDIMAHIHTPVAAVSLERVDRAKKAVTVLVEIVAPIAATALRCQREALDTCEILSREGAVCSQGDCTFDSRSSLFVTPVRAVFSGIALSDDWIPATSNTVAINERDLPYCTGFTAEKEVTKILPTLAEVGWTVTLEEFFPAGVAEPEELTEAFSIRVISQGKYELYTSCTMTGIRRIATPEGIRQIRTATTSDRTVVYL